MLISNAILHIIPDNGRAPILSEVELEADSETCFEFISKHVRRLIHTPAAREATFRAESAVYSMVKAYEKGEMRFRELSGNLANRLSEMMRDNPDIPPGDLLICAFDYAKQRFLAVVKLPYSECFTHRLLETESGTEVRLAKEQTVLPMTGTKVTEACLVPFDPMVLHVLEKQYPVEGEMTSYFSDRFLECDTEMSRKETAGIIQEIAAEVNTEFFGGDINMESRLKCALVEQASEEEEESLNLESAVRHAYGEHGEAVERFVTRVKEMGVPHEVKLAKNYVQREFKVQHIKADNGIEIKIPLELSQNPEAIQITTNRDGSMSITLKNLRNTDMG